MEEGVGGGLGRKVDEDFEVIFRDFEVIDVLGSGCLTWSHLISGEEYNAKGCIEWIKGSKGKVDHKFCGAHLRFLDIQCSDYLIIHYQSRTMTSINEIILPAPAE